MNRIKRALGQAAGAEKQAQPAFIAPMLATLTHDSFSNAAWLYERKLDGERCVVVKKGRAVNILSRNRKALDDTYPELIEALRKQAGSFIADGEIVAFRGKRTSFSRLQERMKITAPGEARDSPVKVWLYLFDLMFADGYSLCKLPLRQRKKVLKAVIAPGDPLRLSSYRNKEGETFYRQACRKGWEGLIAKDAESTYASSRSRDWLKFKCVNQQELVIGGYTDPEGERTGFGALLMGYYEKDKLRYAGKVGTGYDTETRGRLLKKMKNLSRRTPPFDSAEIPEKNAHWVSPRLVAEVGFTEWTGKNRLRHPRYLGLRDDKDAQDVVKEA